MYRVLMLAFALSAQAFAANEARHPVGKWVDLKGSESFEFTADHKVGIGLKGQPDYMSGTIALSSSREWAPGNFEHTYEMTFINPRGTRGVLTCKVVFAFIMGGQEATMRNAGGGAGCPATAHLAKAMELFGPARESVAKTARPQVRPATPAQEEMIEMPVDDDDDASASQ